MTENILEIATFAAAGGRALYNPFLAYIQHNRRLCFSFLTPAFPPRGVDPDLEFAQALVRDAAAEGMGISNLVNKMNLGLCDRGARRPVALFCGVYDVAGGSLTYVAAGQYADVIGRDGSVRSLEAGGTALGSDSRYVHEAESESLQPGDLLVVYDYHFAHEFDPVRLLEMARSNAQSGANAAAVRDEAMIPWSQRRMADAEMNRGGALFFSVPAGSAEGAMASSYWEEENIHLGSKETRAYWSRTFSVPVTKTFIAAA